MQLDKGTGKRQPDTGALGMHLVDLIESFEYAVEVFLADTLTVVSDRKGERVTAHGT